MTLILPNTFVNDTVASATPVEQNYTYIENYVNNELIHRNGSVAMDAPLTVVSPPSQPTHAASKAYVDAVLPIGVMFPYGGETVPSASWMLCNGAVLPQASYLPLFGVLGHHYTPTGVTVPDGQFYLPNMMGRMMIGVWPDTGATVNDADCNVVGEVGGTTVPPVKAHTHVISHTHPANTTGNQSVTHTHDIDHNHASFNTARIPDHLHSGHYINTHVPASGTDLPVFVASTASSYSGTANLQAGGGADGDTAMTIDIPLSSGLVSGNASVTHNHTTPALAFTGNSGAVVETVATKYRPPYVTVSYIIKVL